MKGQNSQRGGPVLLAAIGTLFLLGTLAATFGQGPGAKYGARDPRTCNDKTSPKTGSLSAAKATEYAICENEHESGGGYLYLVEDIKVTQVGAGRRYNPREDINFSGIDTKFLIYPIRGSYSSYQCTAIFPDKTNTNRNCNTYSAPNAKGACYKKEFGEWRCMLVDVNEAKTAENLPPPGAAKKPAAADEKPQAKNIEQNDQAGMPGATKAANGPPKPDFSEMEDWFEIVRYEYPKPPETRMWVYFRSKTDASKPYIFYVEFRDKDGILVQAADYSPICCSSELMETAKGEMAKVRIELPSEPIMKQVTSIKVIRAK
ncbi:MAG: hypothetical protein ABIO36_06650 [Pyrinomonadaceae bacterium]